jgi:predicted kinase
MAQRRAAGRIRECHGDLHAGNIVRRGGRLVAFDCLEFEPRLRWIDVADEIAFLIADLDVRQHTAHAHAFWTGYLTESGDYQSCRLLRLYSAHRSLVRAKVAVARARETPERTRGDTALERPGIAGYIDGARRALGSGPAVLILMQGLSGSGKTWLARRIAPTLRAAHLRSDVERGRLEGRSEKGHSGLGVGEGIYSAQATAQVYQHLQQCASDVLAGGYTVIVDATFIQRTDRLRFASLGQSLGARVALIHCRAPTEVLESRIAERRRQGDDASEADLDVLRWQLGHAEPLQAEESFQVIEADTAVAGVEDRVLAALSGRR